MKTMMWVAVIVFGASAAQAAAPSCDDDLAHVLNVGIPRTSLADDEPARLAQAIGDVLGGAYADPCRKGKVLQLNFAFGSDYEIQDWLERGSIDAAIVPNLPLHLLIARDAIPLRELNPDASSRLEILRAVAPAPSCRHYASGRWSPCAQDALSTFDAIVADAAAGRPAGARRVMFASHLSSTGFLDPIERAARALEKRGTSVETREAVWSRLFDVVRFAVDSSDENVFAYALEEEKNPRELTVVFFPGEEALQRTPVANAGGTAWREHFAVSEAAAPLFAAAAFVDLAAGKPKLVGEPLASLLDEEHPPRPLEIIAKAEPVFGVRSYAFSLHESLRLIEQQQRSSGVDQLALVLPGGGVKAAYQSVIVDHLYGQRELRNIHVAAPKSPRALVVRSVLGTSGGALLGFFVSQLGAEGPFRLTEILWGPSGERLSGSSVFGLTDMPRYFSIAWTFIVFCVLLAFVTGRHTSRFYQRRPAPLGSWRWRLLTLFAVFLVVPILIRFVTGGDEIEHVPVIEGLFYSILTILVMFADQCLVYAPGSDAAQRSVRLYVIVLALLGTLFVFGSFFGVFSDAMQTPVTFGFAFFTLLTIFVGCPLVLLYVAGKLGDLPGRIADVLGSVVVVLGLFAFGLHGLLSEEVPHILALLVLLILAFVVYWYAKQPVRKRPVASLLTFLTVFSTAVLCWKYDSGVRPTWIPSLSFLRADALEGTLFAPFLASTGCLLLVVGAMVWVYQSQTYTLREDEGFARAIVLLIAHAFVTAVLVSVAAWWWPGRVHNLEMTPSFWAALTIFGALVGAAILTLAPRYDQARLAIDFLSSEHPNGALVPRRYARMLAIATISVVWWNGVVAPAIYGNRPARKYIDDVIRRFDAAYRKRPGNTPAAGDTARGFIPTVKFVAPTNTLEEEDATRYFLFLPENDPAAVPRSVAGAQWATYQTTSVSSAKPNCAGRKLEPACVGFVKDVVFSSGSPFPSFAAHRVAMPGSNDKVGLIDGGYSNDIPIDAARTLQAKQAIIVHSSPPFGTDTHTKATTPFSAGMLIRNATRLPSFMFERSQQADRISRQNLFVVGVAPKLAPGESWPGLAQFDAPTVDALIAKAERNLYERIGFVESWGEPRFRVSQQLVILTLSRLPTTAARR